MLRQLVRPLLALSVNPPSCFINNSGAVTVRSIQTSFPLKFCKVTDSVCTEQYLDSVYEAGVDDDDPLGDLSPSKIWQQNSYESIEDVLNNIHSESKLSSEAIAHKIVSLYSLQSNLSSEERNVDMDEEFQLKAAFNRQLLSDPRFEQLTKLLIPHVTSLPTTTSSYLFLCLRRLEVPVHSDIMQNLVIQLRKQVNTMDATSLSYFCVGLRGRNMFTSNLLTYNLMWELCMVPALPRLKQLIGGMTSCSDVHKLAVCLLSMGRTVSHDLMLQFMQKVSDLAQEMELDEASIVKVISLTLTHRDWHLDKSHWCRNLMLKLQKKTHNLNPVEAMIVAKVVSDSLSPIGLHYEVAWTLRRLLENDGLKGVPKIDVVATLLTLNVQSFSTEQIEEIVMDTLNGPTFKSHIGEVQHILRRCPELCTDDTLTLYFNRAFEACKNDMHDLTRLSTRYFNFWTTLGELLRSKEFEQNVAQVFLKDVVTTPFSGTFAKEFAFLLGYAWEEIPPQVFDRFYSVVGNMDAFSLYLVARGIESMSNHLNYTYRRDNRVPQFGPVLGSSTAGVTKNEPPPSIIAQIESMNFALTKRSRELLESSSDFATKFLVFRNLSVRKHDEDSFDTVIQSITKDLKDKTRISFFALRQIAFCLFPIRPSYEAADLVEAMLDYLLENKNHIHFNAASRLMAVVFLSNYDKDLEKRQAFTQLTAALLLRDFETQNPSHIVDMSISLAGHKSLTPQLAEKIFSQKFMKDLDNELKLYKDNGFVRGYTRIRNKMMELNRTVCLQYPEYKVPWFHEKYCQEEAHSWNRNRRSNSGQDATNKLREDVYNSLVDTVGSCRCIRENVYSTYWNYIDFELALDEDTQKFLPIGDTDNLVVQRKSGQIRNSTSAQRFAVVIHSHDDYTHDTKKLTGKPRMDETNLQLQGYNVVSVNPYTWNAMAMAIGKAKKDFFKRRLAVT